MNTPARRVPNRALRRGSVLAGCLITLGVVFVLLAALIVWCAMNWRGWVASWTVQGTHAVLAESNLPPEQKQAITTEIEALANDFKEKRVSLEELGRVVEQIKDSPLLPLAGVQVAKEQYIDGSPMTSEEKAASERSLQRFARGIYEKKIKPAEEQITDVIKPVVRLKPGNQWEFKKNPTRLEIDQFIANCKAKADEASIPDEPFQIDFAQEIRAIIAKARGLPPPPPPQPAPTQPAPAPEPQTPPSGGG